MSLNLLIYKKGFKLLRFQESNDRMLRMQPPWGLVYIGTHQILLLLPVPFHLTTLPLFFL